MPEGHTVHRLARALDGLFGGETLAVSSPQGRFAGGAALLDGHRMVAAEAWGKQLFCAFAPGLAEVPPARGSQGAGDPDGVRWLRVHLGLYGAWSFAGDGSADVVHAIGAPRRRIGERESTPDDGGDPAVDVAGEWVPPAPRGAVRLRLLGSHAVADLTGPTACEVLTAAEKAAVEARLGPDPIRDGGDAARRAFVERVRRSRVTIGQQLMDQAVIAGVGNIYRAEALFRAGVDPLKAGRDVPETALAEIWDDLVVLMRDGAERGAIVTTRPEHRLADGGGGRVTRQNTDGDADAVPRDASFYVYHRDGLPCRVCGAPVLTKELAGRNLFWCGVCQA